MFRWGWRTCQVLWEPPKQSSAFSPGASWLPPKKSPWLQSILFIKWKCQSFKKELCTVFTIRPMHCQQSCKSTLEWLISCKIFHSRKTLKKSKIIRLGDGLVADLPAAHMEVFPVFCICCLIFHVHSFKGVWVFSNLKSPGKASWWSWTAQVESLMVQIDASKNKDIFFTFLLQISFSPCSGARPRDWHDC